MGAPTGSGLPLEVYAFTSSVEWTEYEAVQSDIFDHVLAIISSFDLKLTQSPSGHDIKNFIKDWSKYWQNKNYQEYFNSYSQNYFSKKFKSNEAWKKDRKSKIENKKNIEIKISDIKVISFDNKNALVQFTQSYNSDSFSDVVKKHIIISTISRNYKITGEFILK